jgi:hypothetical protein
MGKHGKLVNVLMKLHFLEDSQRSIKEIRKQIEHYEKRNLEPFSLLDHRTCFSYSIHLYILTYVCTSIVLTDLC